MMERKKQPVAAESRRLTRAGNLWSQRQGGLHECYQNWLYYSVVLIITLTAGGTRVSAYGATPPRRMVMRHLGGRGAVKCHAERSRVKRSFTKAQASQPWIHVALSLLSPFVRLLRRLTTAARPCGTRAAFAATNVADHAGAKAHVTHSAINPILLQSEPRECLALPPFLTYFSGLRGQAALPVPTRLSTFFHEETP